MFGVLLLLAAAKIPVGAYPMPALLKELSNATGETYFLTKNLRDYPVFVSVKSGDPQRVKSLVASCLQAEWQVSGKTYTLVPKGALSFSDQAEFEEQFKASCPKSSFWTAMSIKWFYECQVNPVYRVGDQTNMNVSRWPRNDANPSGSARRILIRRNATGFFEWRGFDSKGEIRFNQLLKPVQDLLGQSLDKVVVDAPQKYKGPSPTATGQSIRLYYSDLDKRDPVATLAERGLTAVAQTIDPDMVVALPDGLLFELTKEKAGNNTVRSILSPYSMAVNWRVIDGALVGQRPDSECFDPTQGIRRNLARMIRDLGETGLGNIAGLRGLAPDLIRYPFIFPGALLVKCSGIAVDDDYLNEYPLIVMFFCTLNQAEQAVIESEEPFPQSKLARSGHFYLGALMGSRSRVEGVKGDSGIQQDIGWWPRVNEGELMVTPEMIDEPVLLCHSSMFVKILSVEKAVQAYTNGIGSNRSEPLYQLANRRKYKLVATPNWDQGRVETGYSQVALVDPQAKPCAWKDLPEEIKTQFEKAIASKPKETAPPDPIKP